MDTSGTYIKMCEKAEELQKHSFGEGDYHGLLQNGLWSAHNYCEESGFVGISPQKLIWLPRQDQLQEMVGDTPYYNIKNAMWSVLDDFRNFAFATNFKEFIPLTMEQLWLAFAMKEKYNKVWDGEKWVKSKSG